MAMRISGLMSGMDTETIISQLVEAKKTKVNKAIKAQKSLKYKQDAWKTLNTQIKKLHSNALSNLRFESSFIKKTTKVSNSNVLSVITGEGAMNSVQSLEVTELAKSAYLTGGDLRKYEAGGTEQTREVTGDTKLSELGLAAGTAGTIDINVGGELTTIQVNGDTTVNSFVKSLKDAGLNANFDQANGRIHVVSKSSGTKNDFDIFGANQGGLEALKALKLEYNSPAVKANYQSALGNGVDYNNSAAVQQVITDREDAELQTLTTRRSDLQGKADDMLVGLMNGTGTEATAFQSALTTAGINISGKSYADLTDAEKAAIGSAFDSALEDSSLSEDDKKKLNELKSAWNSNEAQLSAVESRLDIDAANGSVKGLAATVKSSIASVVNNAVDMLKSMDQIGDDGEGKKQAAMDAKIKLNGVEYTSDKNTFQVNGLTLTVNMKTDTTGPVTITTQDDTDGIYDMIKDFFKEYNTLINQMDKLYGAESAKEYEPLLDEEKDAMSDSEIEEWENKIKDSILRKDSTLGTLASEMKRIMMEGAEVDGKKMYLSNFGINTLGYFIAPEFEKNAYHIDGDADDGETSGNADVLKSMIANDPDTVVGFFTQLAKNLYGKMSELMGPTEYSSAMTAYDDKKMKTEYDDYTAKIKDLENKLADYEDKWYAKFASMETALAKMQQNASAVTALLGGGA